MKTFRKAIYLVFAVLFLLLLNSCSKKMGYSVVLWSIPEENIQDGTVVPVFIKSNIMHCYVIGIPNTDRKCEVPLWQITTPTSKYKTKATLQKYAEYQHKYASVKRDGLPIRQEAQNTARQVYRTREGEILRVLYKGEGATVMAGQNALPGEWLRVLTNDGTVGWCFSYNLTVFDESEKAKFVLQDSLENENENENETSAPFDDRTYDELLKKVLSATWYPEEYQKMINDRRIDLSRFNPDYKFDTGFQSGVATLNLKDINLSFDFIGVNKIANRVYNFSGTKLTMTIRTASSILLQYVEKNDRQRNFNLVTLSENIETVIQNEENRRNNEYNKILFAGPIFHSTNYGDLFFKGGNVFDWTSYDLLTPSLIERNSGTSGQISFDYFIANALKSDFDGVISFMFNANGRKINFLYKIEENGIRLEDAQKARYKDNLVLERSSNPVVMFFAK